MGILTVEKVSHGVRLQDCYETPVDVLEDFVRVAFKPQGGGQLGDVLDPCSGDDRRFRSVWADHAMSWMDNELRTVSAAGTKPVSADTHADFVNLAEWPRIHEYMATGTDWRPNSIVMNPPFSLLGDFVERALELATDHVIMLARLAILEGQARYRAIWSKHPPTRIYVLSKRPSFSGDGRTDKAQAYAWIWWDKSMAKADLIPTTTVHWIPPREVAE